MKQIAILKPKTQTLTGFVYSGLNDLENLCKFVGSAPQIESDKGKISLKYKKNVINPDSVVFVDAFGTVTRVMPVAEVEAQFEVVQSVDFSKEYILTPAAKVAPEKKTKEK